MSLPVWQCSEVPMPPYIELCVETVRRHYPDAQLLDREALRALS